MMDQAQRTTVIAAAVAAVGPAGADLAAWRRKVDELAAAIAAMASDGSPTARLIDSIGAAKTFTATLVGGHREPSSSRVVVKLRTRPSTFHPDGIEEARIERTDTPAGETMADRLRALIGHRVVVWIEVEDINGGASKFRVLRHIEDLGNDGTPAPSHHPRNPTNTEGIHQPS